MRRVIACALLLTTFAADGVAGEEASTGRPETTEAVKIARQAYREAYGLILKRRWRDAEIAFTNLVHRPSIAETDEDTVGTQSEEEPIREKGVRLPRTSSLYDDARFWQCYAAEKGGDPERGFDCYNKLSNEMPASAWADDADAAMVRLAMTLAETNPEDRGGYAIAVALLEEESEKELQLAALAMFAQQGDKDRRIVEGLRELYEDSESPGFNQGIVAFLKRVDSAEARELIGEIALTDPDYETRMWAVKCMLHSQCIRTLSRVAFEDDILRVQTTAVQVLAQVGDKGAIDALIEVVEEHPLSEVRVVAVEGLSQADDPEARKNRDKLLKLFAPDRAN